jgi:hypothetical protein
MKVLSLGNVKHHFFLKMGVRFMKKQKIFITAYRAVLAAYITTQVEPRFVTE